MSTQAEAKQVAHTPGPLVIANCLAVNEYSLAAPDGHFARITFSTRFTAEDCRAFASALAATSDLLEALKAANEIIPRHQLTEGETGALRLIDAALAKAGER